MKTFIALTLVFLTIFMLACSSDEIINNSQQETNLVVDSQDPIQAATSALMITETNAEDPKNEQNTQNRSSVFPCDPPISCFQQVVIDTLHPNSTGYRVIQIEYDNSLPLSEVDCARRQFFDCFEELKMNFLQNSDPYRDTWRYPISDPQPKTNKVLDGSIDDDPRTCPGTC